MSSIVDIIWKMCYHTVYIKIGGFAMKKRLSCIILTLVMIISLVPFAAAASDEATEAAEALYELGLFKGTGTNPDGTPIFDLDKTPTRNQAIIMLVRLLGKEEEANRYFSSVFFGNVFGIAYTLRRSDENLERTLSVFDTCYQTFNLAVALYGCVHLVKIASQIVHMGIKNRPCAEITH